MKIWPIVITIGVALAVTVGIMVYHANRFAELAPVDQALTGAEIVVDRIDRTAFYVGSTKAAKNFSRDLTKVYVLKKPINEVIAKLERDLSDSTWKRQEYVDDGSSNSKIVNRITSFGSNFYGKSFGWLEVFQGKVDEEKASDILSSIYMDSSIPGPFDSQYTTVILKYGPVEPNILDRATDFLMPGTK